MDLCKQTLNIKLLWQEADVIVSLFWKYLAKNLKNMYGVIWRHPNGQNAKYIHNIQQ